MKLNLKNKNHYSKIISPEQLSADLANPQLKLIDVRASQEYAAGHIPAAINIFYQDFEDPDNVIDGELATPLQFESLMRHKGINNEDVLVVYSSVDMPQMASRLIWALEVYGHRHTYILDGHYESWRELYPTTNAVEPPMTEESDYQITQINAEINLGVELSSSYRKQLCCSIAGPQPNITATPNPVRICGRATYRVPKICFSKIL